VRLFAENLVVERGGRVVVDGVSIVVAAGETLVLTGANGAGKTTLLRALAGFLPLLSGSISLDGQDPDTPRIELIHVIGHANAVKAHLTVRENVMFWAQFLGGHAGAADRTDQALGAFSLSELEDFPASFLSAGQKRRVGLARLLAAPRPVWLLDEPTVSLDTASTAQLAAAINAHIADGGLAIAATHMPLGLERTREFRLHRVGLSA
jgi:heme exporter protein A